MINQEHNYAQSTAFYARHRKERKKVYHKERKGAILGFNLIQIVMPPIGMFQSYHVVLRIVRSGSQLNERCVEDETLLKKWQCPLNARKSTVHNSSLVKLRPKSLANLSNLPFLNVHVQCLGWCKTD